MKDILELLARACLAVIFVFESWDNIVHFKTAKAQMIQNGLTWNTDFLLKSACIFLVMGSLMLLFGYRAKLGALLLLAYLIPVAFIAHDWWTIYHGDDRHTMSIVFMKDLAVIGGLLMVYVNGSGRFSIKKLLATTRVRTVF
jgi:putative oxidoreductase